MAVNAYLIIEGIKGPSTSKTGAIDVLSFSWGSSMTGTFGAGASGQEKRAGRADFGPLSIMKVLDSTSAELFSNCVTGDIMKKVVLLYDKAINTQQEDYFRITLKHALITSVQLSGSAENPVESLSFAYEAIELAYRAEKDDATGTLNAFVPKGFNLADLKDWTAE